MWQNLIAEFSTISLFMKSDMRTKFMELRYRPGTNLTTEFDRIRIEYERCSQNGIEISDSDYRALITKFVPVNLAAFIATITAQAQASLLLRRQQQGLGTGNDEEERSEEMSLSPENMMILLTQEWEHLENEKPTKFSKAKETLPGLATLTMVSERPGAKAGGGNRWHGRGRGPQRPIGVCWSCGEPGHRQSACPKGSNDQCTNHVPQTNQNRCYNHPNRNSGGCPNYSQNFHQNNGTANAANFSNLDNIAGAWSATQTYVEYLDDVLKYPLWTEDDEVWTLGNDIDAAFFDEVNEEDNPWADMPDLLPVEDESGSKGTQTEFRVSNICGDEHNQITHQNGDDDLDPMCLLLQLSTNQLFSIGTHVSNVRTVLCVCRK